MRKTKIIGTLGPASNSKEVIAKLIQAGLDVVRLNFSHGDYNEHGRRIDIVKEIEKEVGKPIGIMMDTKGPEIRTGKLKEGKVELFSGDKLILTTEEIEGDSSRVSISYRNLPKDVEPGCMLLIDDGLIELKVLKVSGKEITCEVINGGILGSQKGVNIPGVSLKLPAITDKDRADIVFGIEKGVNFIAASFVRKASDVLEIRKLLEEHNAGNIYIIAKIENQEGVDNIDDILEVADGIMIARGDLGVEIPPEKVPVVQKRLIRKCNKAAKPVITATQMLESMIHNPRPTRAEASDVANAIYDSTDAIMLSGETAIGDYPVAAVKTMARIAEVIEKSTLYQERMEKVKPPSASTVTEAISFASGKTAMDLKAKCIITSTTSGYTARMVAKHRPMIPIIGATHDEQVQHLLTLSWGVYPLKVKESTTTDEMIANSINAVQEYGYVEKGDLVVITAGVPVSMSGTTNLIEVMTV